jgi:hypothetical protein
MLTFAAAGLGTTPQHFYWNFANLDDVDLVAVRITPEPGAFGALAVACGMMLSRRRRCR